VDRGQKKISSLGNSQSSLDAEVQKITKAITDIDDILRKRVLGISFY
jgi:hypothetical protein